METTHPVLTTARFTLKPMTRVEAPLLADLGADPDVVKTLICDWSTSRRRLAIARYWIRRNQDHGIWGVHDREGAFGRRDRFIGFCAADEPLPQGGLGPEIYYAFSQDSWGQGVASEVVPCVIAHLFEAQAVAAVEALVLAGLNPASTRLVEKLGMELVGRYSLLDYVGKECGPTIGYELWRVETAPPQRAGQALAEAAFKIGQFVAAGVEPKDAMAAALHKAAAANGHAMAEAGKVIVDKLTAGMAETGWLHYRVQADDFVSDQNN